MAADFGTSLLEATDLEIGQRDKYVKAFENEYRLTHPLRSFVPATNKDIGSKAIVAHVSTVAINMTTAGATGTVFYFLELEVLAKEFHVAITNPAVMFVAGIFALAAVMGIDFTLTSTGLAKGETDEHPYTDSTSHWAAGITAATAGVFRGLLYFQIIPPGTPIETVVKSIVLLAIAVLPVLVLYPAARISGYYLGWVYKENKKRSIEYERIQDEWMQDFQSAFRSYVSTRVSTANALQKKMIQQAPNMPQLSSPPITVIQPSGPTGEITNYIRQAIEAVCAESSRFDLLTFRPTDVRDHLASVGVVGINENTLRPTTMRVKAIMLNDILDDLDASPFQPPEEFCVKLSQRFKREVKPQEITGPLLTIMREKYENAQ